MVSESSYATEQERFWSGEFGDRYRERNLGDHLVAANTALFADILSYAAPIGSVFEVGANIGLNVRALQALLPGAELAGLEINEEAAAELKRTGCTVFRGSALSFEPPRTYDLVFTKGVLIHLPPDHLRRAYSLLHGATNRYLLVAEYYSPQPESVPYRGETEKLFRRDFAGEILDAFPDLRLVRTGFAYHRAAFPQDDLTWFLMEKDK